MGGVVTLDGTAAAAIGAVVDVCIVAVVLICPGEGCCGGRFDGVEPFTIGVVLAALGVAATAVGTAAAAAGGTSCGGGCARWSCCCGCCA